MKRIFRGCAIGVCILVVISVIGRALGGGETPTQRVAPLADIGPTVTKRIQPTATSKPVDAVPAAQPTIVTETVAPVAVATVNTTANVRDVPRPEASTVLGTVETGVIVHLLMRNADATWYGVTTPEGLTGWVSASLLTIDESMAALVPEGTAEDLGVTAPEPAVAAPAEAPAAPAAIDPKLNTNGQDLYNCSDFATWTEANAVFQANLPGDPNKLDGNDDGAPCDSLR